MSSSNIETDEADDVLGSVKHAIFCWELAEKEPYAWKWVILALHSALQGACVCYLTGTTRPLWAVPERNRKEWEVYFQSYRSDNPSPLPKTELMALPDLLKAVRQPDSVGQGSESNHQVTIDDREFNWLKRIHQDFRNQFTHFSPTGWYFDVSGLPELAKLISRIIDDIYKCGWAFRRLNEPKRMSLETNLTLLCDLALAK